MLYKKNSSKSLSKELFKNPTSEYRGTPFWSWNCDLNEGLLERQINVLKEMGFGGFHMHSRSGMSMPYLGETFMNRIKFCTKKAKENGMLAWLYDEDRWPSGAAGGLVTKDKRLRNKYIIFYPSDTVTNDLPRDKATEEGKPYFAAAYDIIKDKDGCILSYKLMDRKATPEGEGWYAFVCPFPDNQAWFNDQAYLDTMDDEATGKFIDITYNSYKKNVGEYFDDTVPAIFTDEPNLFAMPSALPKTATAREPVMLPWSRLLQEKYEEVYGENILEILPEVIWNLPDGKYSWKRYRFYDFIAERFTSAFSDKCGNWCRENNISYTGHVLGEQSLETQTNGLGEAMRPYRAFQIPGIDMLCNWKELSTAKQCQSAVHQFGKEAMISELYGVTNWTFDFRGHKYQGDWQAALGVTVRVPHLSWVSMQGEAKRDYPASINYQSPWYTEYSFIENHYARLNTALTRGTPYINVGVIHPIESYWLVRGPLNQTEALRNAAEKKLQDITSWLLDGHYDFNFISESLLPSLENDNPRAVGKMAYDVIVIPDCITLRSSTLKFLENFKKTGGSVLFVGDCPEYIDAKESDAAHNLYNSSQVVSFDKPAIMNALKPFATVTIDTEEGLTAERFLYSMRFDGADRWLFIANRYPLNDEHWRKEFGGFENHEELVIKLKGIFYPAVYDTLSGEIKPITYEIKDGVTEIRTTMYSNDSLLIKLCSDMAELPDDSNFVKKEAKSAGSAEDTIMNYFTNLAVGSETGFTIKDKVKYKRHEPNVLLLDMAEMALDGGEYESFDEILRGYGEIRKKIGWAFSIGEQPWVLPDEAPSHTVRCRMKIESEIDYPSPVLALELADKCEIFWNGQKVENAPDGWYVDESIGKVSLPPLKKGVNELIVNVPVSPRTTVEYFYLLGDFNVRVEGTKTTITAPTDKIGFGDITSQGLPFYGGNIDYNIDITLENDAQVKIHAYKYAGALLGIAVDGKPAGKIVFEPYNFTTEKLSAGKHTITITCFGNRNNTFGALHWHSEHRSWFGPDAWRKNGDEWAYEYNLAPTGLLASPWFTPEV